MMGHPGRRLTTSEIEAALAASEAKAAEAARRQAAARKRRDPLAVLDEFDARLAIIAAARERAALERDLAGSRAEDQRQDVIALAAAGAPAAEITKAEHRLGELQAEAGSPRHHQRIGAQESARRAVRAEREAAARAAWDGMAGQLRAEGEALAASVDDLAKARAELAAEWQALDARWQRLERAAGGPAFRGRQSLPPFPLPAGDAAIRPWPGGTPGLNWSTAPLPAGALPLPVTMAQADAAGIPSIPEQAGRPADWGGGRRDKPAGKPGPLDALPAAPADDDVPDLEPAA